MCRDGIVVALCVFTKSRPVFWRRLTCQLSLGSFHSWSCFVFGTREKLESLLFLFIILFDSWRANRSKNRKESMCSSCLFTVCCIFAVCCRFFAGLLLFCLFVLLGFRSFEDRTKIEICFIGRAKYLFVDFDPDFQDFCCSVKFWTFPKSFSKF